MISNLQKTLIIFSFLVGSFVSILIGVFLWANDTDSVEFNHIKTIYLWTRESHIVAEELSTNPGDLSILHQGSFSPYRTTYVITHGFLSSALYNWVITLKDVLLSEEDCNVLALSWESGSHSLSYYVVQARVPQVGQEVTLVLQYLALHSGLSYDRLHLIGHSLGAHVSGFIGKALNGSVARITGLDPAGMGFNNADPQHRLDKSDAKFVDVIHTEGCETLIQTYQCYGISHSIGHVDIWVNGGQQQPACEEEGDGQRILEQGSHCSHSLAYVYYTESIGYSASTTHYLVRACDSEEHFANDSCQCPPYPQYMGYNVNQRSQGDFYLKTKSVWPYSLEDQSCPAAKFSWLQTFGIILLSLLMGVCLLTLSAVVWLQYHPQHREYFSAEVLAMLSIAVGDQLQTCYEGIKSCAEHSSEEEEG